MSPWFWQTLHRRVVAVGVMVCFVAIGAAAVRSDARHSRMVFDRVADRANWLLDQLERSEARIAYDIPRGERGLRVTHTQRLESTFRLDDGLAAFITLGDEVLWQSDERLGKPPSSEPPVQGRGGGIETISYAGRMHEAYLARKTVIREWPVPADTAGLSGMSARRKRTR